MIYKIPTTAIIHELLDNEVIIANLDTGVYYSLRNSAVQIWQLLLSFHSKSQIVDLFTKRYDKDLADPIAHLIDQILAENLLVERDEIIASSFDVIWPADFKEPLLEKYDEMKTLLMLDPIHEVDEQGWPSRAK